ncbi:MAG: hypothetical protein ABMB14_37590 [Myxococcota bacterium]
MSARRFGIAAVAVALAGCGAEYAIAPVDVHPGEVTACAFEPVDGAPGLERYTCNPVFTSSDEPWAATLTATSFGTTNVLDHPFYQLWYFAQSDGGPLAGYATSPDGTTWTPHDDNPQWDGDASGWDGGMVFGTEVAWDPDLRRYVLLYGAASADQSAFGLGVATSWDGAHWDAAPTNPVLDLRLPFAGTQVTWPLSMEITDGGVSAYVGALIDADRVGMWRLESDDVTALTGLGERVFDPGTNGAFDDLGFVDASIAELDGVEYLFYVGFGAWKDLGNGVRGTTDQFLGLATSTDGGASWTRTSTDPLPVHLDPDGAIGSVAARTVGSRILLWVTDTYPDLGPGVGYFVYTPPGAGGEE